MPMAVSSAAHADRVRSICRKVVKEVSVAAGLLQQDIWHQPVHGNARVSAWSQSKTTKTNDSTE